MQAWIRKSLRLAALLAVASLPLASDNILATVLALINISIIIIIYKML